jgi:predicted metalloendopeptidase
MQYEDSSKFGRQWQNLNSSSDLEEEAVRLTELDEQDEEAADPLRSNPNVIGELGRLKMKHRKLKRSFHFLLIFSCCMVLLILFFSYRTYRGYYPPINGTDSEEIPPSASPPAPASRYTAYASAVLGDTDPSADPCTDFYRYACGGFLDRTVLEANEVRRGRSFDTIATQNRQILLSLLQNQSLPYLSSLYSTCMNLELAEDASAQRELLNVLSTATDLPSLYRAAARLRLQHGIDIGLFFSLSISIDDRQPTRYIPVLWQASPLLPDASYYTDTAMLTRYRQWMSDAFSAAGLDAPSPDTLQRLIALEQKLLAISNSPAQNRDPEKTYRLMTKSELTGLLRDAKVYVDAVLPDLEIVNVAQFQYFLQLYSTLNTFSFAELSLYATLRLISSTLSLFGTEQRAASLSYKTMLYGVTEAGEREEFCVGVAQQLAGMRLSYFYVQQHFDERSRNIVGDMINRIERSYVDTVGELEWMDSSTRTTAIDKLNAIANMVGHPDVWPEWSAPAVGSTLFAYYAQASRDADTAELAKLTQPVDNRQWEMLPSAVNAYYEPSLNIIVFPAGILQPPFFDSQQPVAANYGAIGSVIGHELGHSLDDQGSQYTANGTLNDWWSATSRAKFNSAAQCVANLYSSYAVAPNVFVNGQLVLGESIADMAGLRQAYRALQAWKRDYAALAEAEEQEVQRAFGMSSERLYFLSYAQNWCSKSTTEYEIALAATNPHPPSEFRVLGPLSNSADFATVFECPANSPYASEQPCVVW